MAIDSAPKRASALSQFTGHPLIIPDGTISQADKQTILLKYGGILASTLTAAKGGFNNISWWWFND